jgi:hypothetical protein
MCAGNGSHNNEPGKLPPAPPAEKASYDPQTGRRNPTVKTTQNNWSPAHAPFAPVGITAERDAVPGCAPPRRQPSLAQAVSAHRCTTQPRQGRCDVPTYLEPHHSLVKEHRSRLAA